MADDKPKEGKGQPHWLFTLLMFPLIVAVISSLLTYYFTVRAGRIQEMSYYVTALNDLVKRPEIANHKVAVTVDGTPTDNISTLSVTLYNDSGADTDDLPIMLEFNGPEGSPLISEAVDGVPGMPPLFQSEERPGGPVRSGYNPFTMTKLYPLLRHTYLVKLANRSSTQPIFKADFTFLTTAAPNVKVFLQKKGFTAVLRQQNKTGSETTYYFLIVASLAALGVGFVVLVSVRDHRRWRAALEKREVEAIKLETERKLLELEQFRSPRSATVQEMITAFDEWKKRSFTPPDQRHK